MLRTSRVSAWSGRGNWTEVRPLRLLRYFCFLDDPFNDVASDVLRRPPLLFLFLGDFDPGQVLSA